MPEIAPDIFFAGISELSAKLRAKEFSCVELTRAFVTGWSASDRATTPWRFPCGNKPYARPATWIAT